MTLRRRTQCSSLAEAMPFVRRLPSPPPWAVAAWLAVSIGVVYGRALYAPFIFDDEVSIVENGSITSLWPLVGSDERRGVLMPPPGLPTSGRQLVYPSFRAD